MPGGSHRARRFISCTPDATFATMLFRFRLESPQIACYLTRSQKEGSSDECHSQETCSAAG